MKSYISILMIAAMLTLTVSGCVSADAADLMSGVTPGHVSGRPTNTVFTESMSDFSIDLFKSSVADGENSLISPLSVMLALAMTANGADGDTLSQMENLLGGGIPLEELNEYLYSYVNALPSDEKSKLQIANSIWFQDNENTLQVKNDFLGRNADYYGAAAFKSVFDAGTVKEINSWVKSNTDGMIEKIIDEMYEENLMFLINAVVFDAQWQNVYSKEDVRNGDFTNITGGVESVDFMHSSESLYLDDGVATGFIKPYANEVYSFAAMIPNEGVSIESYIESLTGTGFADTLKNAVNTIVYASMPKFEYEYEISMNDALASLGMPDAFDAGKADFGKMAASAYGNIFISEVLHKTFISVDELGTKAGAVTSVAVNATSAPTDPKTVRLDRPFVYAIIDNATMLPVFIGTLLTAQ